MSGLSSIEDRRDQQEKEWDRKSERAADLRDEWRRRWSLSLAVANGGGLVGLASVVMDAGKRPSEWGALMHSAWLFLLGLVFSGFISIVRSHYFEQERGHFWVVARERANDGPTDIGDAEGDFVLSSDVIDARFHAKKRLQRVGNYLEYGSAICFLMGVLLPLVAMTVVALKVVS